MRFLFIILTLLSLISYSQDSINARLNKQKVNNDVENIHCKNYLTTYYDDVVGNTTTYKNVVLKNGSEIITISLNGMAKGQIIMLIYTQGNKGCVDNGDDINLLFTNQDKLTLKNMGDFNCKGEYLYTFTKKNLNLDFLERIRTSKIKTIRVWDSDSYLQNDFTPKQQDIFSGVINCILSIE